MQKDMEKVAWIILSAVKNMRLGKNKLASFLKGSKSKDVAPISGKLIYGGLFWFDIPTIEGFIEQLEGMELIRKRIVQGSQFSYPVLELTDAGKRVLENKIEVPLQIIKEKRPISVRESEKKTLDLFKQKKSAEEIAKERNLALSTIYTHFYRLIANNYLSSSDIISTNIIKQVMETIKKFSKQPSLKELKEILPDTISYEEIRCVLADKEEEKNE